MFRTETRLVPVDVVVQDKKGNYVHDLERKDFTIWEDNKEKEIRNFSFEANPASPIATQRKYLVLMFDLASMNQVDQMQARRLAAKFIDANAGPNRLMALVNLGGTLVVAQNFTDDIERLKQVVSQSQTSIGTSTTGRNARGIPIDGMPRLSGLAQFGELSMLAALRVLANSLGGVPGRKTLVLFSARLSLTVDDYRGDALSDAKAATEACNRANVAIYSVDVRGLLVGPRASPETIWGGAHQTSKLQILDMLAEATGGFMIANTNNFPGEVQRINREQSEYYMLSYEPPESEEGSCHAIRVKVNRSGLKLRARTEYCNVKQAGVLAGKPIEQQMEAVAQGAGGATTMAATMQLPYFYISANTARVHVAMEIPTESIKLQDVKGKQHGEVSVLGIAYGAGGDIAAKFSDVVNLDFEDTKALTEFASKPMYYEDEFDIGSGDYTLRVVFSTGGGNFGKLESPLKVEPYETGHFGVSSVALSTDFRPFSQSVGLDRELDESKKPLVISGVRFLPAGVNRFRPSTLVIAYFEVYDPILEQADASFPVQLAVQMRIVDRASGAEKLNSGRLDGSKFVQVGQRVVPIALKVPVAKLPAGAYRVEVRAMDSRGNSAMRTVEFDLR